MTGHAELQRRRVSLRELLIALESGARPKGGATTDGVVSIGGEHLDGAGGFRLDRLRHIPASFASTLAKGKIRVGDILVVKDGATTGKVALVRPSFPFDEAFVNEHVFLCRPNDSVDATYLYHYLASREGQRQILADFRGAAQGGISRGFVERVSVPLVSIERQRLVADLVEEQDVRIRAAQHDLGRVLRSIDVLRRSVAVAATTGRLVPTEVGLGLDSETAEEFVRRYAGAQSARRRLRPADAWASPNRRLPAGWTWTRLRSLGDLDRGRSTHRPRNDPRLYGGPYPFIQTGDIRRSGGNIRRHSQTYNEAGLAQSKLWPAGTLCITIAANIAETGILSYPACFPDSVVGFVHDGGAVTTRYVQLCIQAVKQRLWELAPATAQKNINLGTLDALAIPLPPPAAQERIVTAVDRITQFAEVMEAEVRVAMRRGDGLREAVLKRVFTSSAETRQ